MSRIDLIRLLDDHFPHLGEVQDALRDQGFAVPSIEAMRKWKRRKGYPGPILAAVLLIIEKRKGQPISLLPYMYTGENYTCATSLSKDKSKPTGAPVTIFD